MKRRTVLQILAAAGAWVRLPLDAGQAIFAQRNLSVVDESRLRALADVVLPAELGPAGQAEVVEQFLRWIRNYREGAEMDHGYGFTRLRRTPASPAARYAEQLASLDRAARTKGSSFERMDRAERGIVVGAALEAAKADRLPARPNGGHVATDLMAFYFNSPSANDLAYRAAIGRDQCRGLPGSDQPPTGVRTGSERGQSTVVGRLKVMG